MMKNLFSRLARDNGGSTIIEFAILAPAFLGLLLGVFQVAISMQAQNALRGVASDTARYAVVEYQKKNEVTNAQIQTEAERIGESAPYLLNTNFTATVTTPVTERVPGAFERTLRLTYQPPAVLPFFDWASPAVNFERPIFMLDE